MALQQTLASYSGHLRHGGSFRAWQRALEHHGWLEIAFALDGWQVRPRWQTSGEDPAPTYGSAYRDCIRPAGEQCLVFWPVGRFIEFYGPQRLLAERVLGLRRTRLARAGYALAAGFPRGLAPHFAAKALHAGFAVAFPAAPASAGSWPRVPRFLLAPRKWEANACPSPGD